MAGLLAGSVLVSAASVQETVASPGKAPASHPASSAKPSRVRKVSPYHANALPAHAKNFYLATWGIEPVGVKEVSSGTMIRFSYKVLDARKAKTLNDKKNTPYLIDPQAHVRLVVPTMEKVGQLRQTATAENGKDYWMVFSNKGGYVKTGHHVDVVIGNFHLGGLVVE